MGNFIIFILAITSLPHITPAVLPKPNPMGALLQNILNPANSERAKQILQLTGAANKVPSNPVLNLLQEVAVPRPSPVIVQEVPRTSQLPRQFVPIQQVQEVVPLSPIPPCSTQVARPLIPDRLYQPPVPLVNPFLPAASPVSAMAPPTSSMLPPVDPTQVRSHFLRKIPIPPPSL